MRFARFSLDTNGVSSVGIFVGSVFIATVSVQVRALTSTASCHLLRPNIAHAQYHQKTGLPDNTMAVITVIQRNGLINLIKTGKMQRMMWFAAYPLRNETQFI